MAAPFIPRDDEARCLEALRRLAVLDTPPDPVLDEMVRLVRDLVGAHAAALTFVAADRAWSKAATHNHLNVARTLSPAARAVVDPDGEFLLTHDRSDSSPSHPVVADVSGPVTCAALAVCAPEGEPIGALEMWWAGDQHVGRTRLDVLRRVASHVGHLLEMRAEANEYRRFVDVSPDPVIVLDVDGTIVLANPALGRLLGYDPRSLVGEAFLDLVDGTVRASITVELARILFADVRAARLELQVRRTDGRLLPCSVSAAPLQGARRRLQLVVHDLSARQRGEEERSRLSEQLARAQRLDAVGRVAGGLAHDLNNLLVVMVSNLGLALESLDAVEAELGRDRVTGLRKDLDELTMAVDRAGRLTTKLLEFARRPSGEDEVTDVAGAVTAVLALTSRSLGPGVDLRVEVAEGLPPVVGDPVKLEQSLVNLVINASDALPDGGNIRLTARFAFGPDPAGERRADVRCSGQDRPGALGTDAGTVLVEVADDGEGMNAGVQARAFEPLFSTKGDGGTGLGLATVAAFVDEIDGTVHLHSAPGEGTRVAMTLPVADRSEAVLPAGRDVPIGGAQILLVDPEERTRRVIVRMLQTGGYQVRTVRSAEDALRSLHDGEVELVITDLSLPGMPGMRLLEELRTRTPEVRAVALATVQAPRTLDGTPVLIKPFSHTRLLRTVERVMRER